MPEHDYISCGEIKDPTLGLVKYSITQTISAVCPRCGNPDCAEILEFIERLKLKISHEECLLKEAAL